MGFRQRLALFVVVILVVVQAITAATIFVFTRETLIQQDENQLTGAADAFTRQLDVVSRQIVSDINAFTPDVQQGSFYAKLNADMASLRQEISQSDGTIVQLIGADGRVQLDSRHAETSATAFGSPALLRQSDGKPYSAAAVMIDDKAYWTVAVPLSNPAPVTWVVASVPLDDAFLRRVGELGFLPQSVALAVRTADGRWSAVAGDSTGSALVSDLSSDLNTLGAGATVANLSRGQDLELASPLATLKDAAPIAVVLGNPIATSLIELRPILVALVVAVCLGILLAMLGAWLIARSIAAPFEALAAAARRVEAGDYAPPPMIKQRDEIGQLSMALANMARGVAEREERIRGWSRHDPVTGLLNRTGLTERMSADLGDEPCTMLLIGLVRLQDTVNTVGRDIADRLMQDAGVRLGTLAKGAPIACVSDQAFVVSLTSCDRAAAVALASEIVLAFERPYQERHLAIDATVAVGIAIAPEHGTEVSLLLRRADVAYLAAIKAQNRVAVYDPDADPRRPEHLSLMVDLRQAVDRKELSLHYQPKLNLNLQRITGVEALVRWQHEFRGNVPPDMFIPLAEETGNIQRLTRWALATGIAQAARWLNRGLALRMSINLSVRDLGDRQLPRRVASLLASHDVPSEYLLLEVTESAIMGEPDTAIAVLHELADQGIALSIDDFGVGHSSLAYLTRLPVREIKIDKSFVQPLAIDSDSQKIVQSVIELGHRLGYAVTAEGVENADSLLGLNMLGCDYAQGYYIAKPLSREQMETFFSDSQWAPARLVVQS